MPESLVCRVSDVPEGQAIKFEFKKDDGVPREGFLTCFEGKWVAYENVCRHLPVSLDYGDGRFFTRDGKFFLCQTHGAVYEPHTGLCVRGPCRGERLFPLKNPGARRFHFFAIGRKGSRSGLTFFPTLNYKAAVE